MVGGEILSERERLHGGEKPLLVHRGIKPQKEILFKIIIEITNLFVDRSILQCDSENFHEAGKVESGEKRRYIDAFINYRIGMGNK